MPSPWIDVSVPLETGVVHWPGDPAASIVQVKHLDRGDSCTLTALDMGAYEGTHIDAPAHFVRGGATMDALPLDAVMGRGGVIDIKTRDAIRPAQQVTPQTLTPELMSHADDRPHPTEEPRARRKVLAKRVDGEDEVAAVVRLEAVFLDAGEEPRIVRTQLPRAHEVLPEQGRRAGVRSRLHAFGEQQRNGAVIDRVVETALGVVQQARVHQHACRSQGVTRPVDFGGHVATNVVRRHNAIPSRSIASGVARSRAFQVSNSSTDITMGEMTTPASCHVRSALRSVMARSSSRST